MSLTLLRDRISTLWMERKTGPHFRWGVITSINPARVRFDGDTSAIAGTPSTLVDAFVLGDRVYCLIENLRVTIIGVGRGVNGTRRFVTKAALDLWPAPDGVTAWVEVDARQYLRTGGTWRAVLENSGWVNLSPAAGVTGIVRYRVLNRVAHFEVNLTAGPVPAGELTQVATGVHPSHRPAVPYAALNLFAGNFFQALAPAVVSASTGALSVRNPHGTAYAGVWMGTGSYALT